METKPCAVKYCKSLWGSVTVEKVFLQDKRLSLEASVMRRAFSQGVYLRRVKSQQMISGTLTKGLKTAGYHRLVLKSDMWIPGPDARCPESARGRKVVGSGVKVTTPQVQALAPVLPFPALSLYFKEDDAYATDVSPCSRATTSSCVRLPAFDEFSPRRPAVFNINPVNRMPWS